MNIGNKYLKWCHGKYEKQRAGIESDPKLRIFFEKMYLVQQTRTKNFTRKCQQTIHKTGFEVAVVKCWPEFCELNCLNAK